MVVSGVVRYPSGAPVAGAIVSLQLVNGGLVTRTDASGHFLVQVDPAQVTSLTISREGFTVQTLSGNAFRAALVGPLGLVVVLGARPFSAPSATRPPTTAGAVGPKPPIQDSLFGFFTRATSIARRPYYGRYTYVLFPRQDRRSTVFLGRIVARFRQSNQPISGAPPGLVNTRAYNLFVLPARPAIETLHLSVLESLDATGFAHTVALFYDTTTATNLLDSYCAKSSRPSQRACWAPRGRGPFLLIALRPFKHWSAVDSAATVIPCDLSDIDEHDFDTVIDVIQRAYNTALPPDQDLPMPVLLTRLSPVLYKISGSLDAVGPTLFAFIDKLKP